MRTEHSKHLSLTSNQFLVLSFFFFLFNEHRSVIEKSTECSIILFFLYMQRSCLTSLLQILQADRFRWQGRWHLEQQEPNGRLQHIYWKALVIPEPSGRVYPKPSHNCTASSPLHFNQTEHVLEILSLNGFNIPTVFPSFKLQVSGLHIKDTIII